MNPAVALPGILLSVVLASIAVGIRAADHPAPDEIQIRGRATLEGKAPPEKILPLPADCARAHAKPPTTRFYSVSADGGLADVIVRVTKGLSDRKMQVPAQPHVIRQFGCIFEPYLSVVQTGQTVLVQNAGAELHNVHLTATRNPERNYAQMPGGQRSIQLAKPEESIRLKCDVHPWEFAYITALDHPFFAVTDANGDFSLPPLPPGEYEGEAKHRKAGTLRHTIHIKPGEPAILDFQFKLIQEQAALQ